MENLPGTQNESSKLELDNSALNHLKETRKWTNFLAIVAFVFLGLGLLIFFIAISASRLTKLGGFETFFFIPVILIIAVYFFPIYYLLMFSRYSAQALVNSDTAAMTEALKFLKMHYRFMGIFTIVILALYLIAFLIMLSMGSIFSSMF